MKKLFLFLAVSSLVLNSCSKDDDGKKIGGTITVTIDGQTKTFNNVVVYEEVYNAGTADEYTDLLVDGSIGNSTNETITFELEKGDTSSNSIYFFYEKNGVIYSYNGMTSTITTNNNSKKLKGNFSGTMSNFSGPEGINLEFTNGSFDIQY